MVKLFAIAARTRKPLVAKGLSKFWSTSGSAGVILQEHPFVSHFTSQEIGPSEFFHLQEPFFCFWEVFQSFSFDVYHSDRGDKGALKRRIALWFGKFALKCLCLSGYRAPRKSIYSTVYVLGSDVTDPLPFQ